MAKFSSSQYRSAVNKLNSQIRQAQQKVNREVKKQVADYNRGVQKYNQEVRKHNTKRKQAIYKFNSDIRRLSQQQRSRTVEVVLVQSGKIEIETRPNVIRLIESQKGLNFQAAPSLDVFQQTLPNLTENEVAETVDTYNLLVQPGELPITENAGELLLDSSFEEVLGAIDSEFVNIWRGALWALDPRNTDRARQFMTSSRELIRLLIDKVAPIEQVLSSHPDCEKDQNNRPTRRAKLKYLCRSLPCQGLSEFVERDIQSTIDLYELLSGGTHRQRNTSNDSALLAIKDRVQHCTGFIISIFKNDSDLEVDVM